MTKGYTSRDWRWSARYFFLMLFKQTWARSARVALAFVDLWVSWHYLFRALRRFLLEKALPLPLLHVR
jgi:hypothetical protein